MILRGENGGGDARDRSGDTPGSVWGLQFTELSQQLASLPGDAFPNGILIEAEYAVEEHEPVEA